MSERFKLGDIVTRIKYRDINWMYLIVGFKNGEYTYVPLGLFIEEGSIDIQNYVFRDLEWRKVYE